MEDFSDDEETFDFDGIGSIDEELGDGDEVVEKPKEKPKEVVKSKEKDSNNNKIEISIDSVESLISNISYSAQELEKAVDRVEKNRELNKILDLLNQIKLHDFSTLEKKIDTKRIEDSIKSTIDLSVKKTLSKIEFKKLEEAAEKYKRYGEIFESEEVMNTFDEIEELQSFRKDFKFKSILSAVVLTAVITLVATLSTVSMFGNFSSQPQQNTTSDVKDIEHFIASSNINYETRDYPEGMQLIFNLNQNIKYFDVKNQNLIVIEYKK